MPIRKDLKKALDVGGIGKKKQPPTNKNKSVDPGIISDSKIINLERSDQRMNFMIDKAYHKAFKIQTTLNGEPGAKILQQAIKSYLLKNGWKVNSY